MGLTADQATRVAPPLLVGVLLAGGFAVVAHLAPRRAVTVPDIQPVIDPGADSDTDFTSTWPQTDWLALSDTLRLLNHLAESETPQDPDAEAATQLPGANAPGADPKDPVVYSAGDFKFIGAIVLGERVVGLIESSGKQRFVRPDDTVGSHTIVAIHPDHLIIRVDGEERRMNLADRGGNNLPADQRYIRDRNRAAEQQRLLQERQSRRNTAEPTPDPSNGR